MKLIVGLGNPGTKYKDTRHNMGYMFVSEVADYFNVKFNLKKEFEAETGSFTYNNEQITLLKPITFMNLSGRAVVKIVNYYKISLDDILVVYDDLDLPAGKLRIRERGSSGGQKGMLSIMEHLNTDEIKRIRIGIDNNKLIDTADYVLGKPTKAEKEALDDVINKAGSMITCYLEQGFDGLSKNYN